MIINEKKMIGLTVRLFFLMTQNQGLPWRYYIKIATTQSIYECSSTWNDNRHLHLYTHNEKYHLYFQRNNWQALVANNSPFQRVL